MFAAGRDFVAREARVLEQRVFATIFEGAPSEGVLAALRAYQNEDGGLGHGLEPDKRCPASQPLDVAFAFQTLDAAGAVDVSLMRRACDFLAGLADEDGGVPIVLPSIASYPRAEHWGDGEFPPSLNPTAGIAGRALKAGIEHPWLDAATRFCWRQLDLALPTDAHTILETLVFLEHVSGRQRAEGFIPRVLGELRTATFFLADPGDPAYGLTPLHFAPAPSSRWRTAFSDEEIDAWLRRLERDQQRDGGWPLTWSAPSTSSQLAWRGQKTLWALTVLAAHRRLEAPSSYRG